MASNPVSDTEQEEPYRLPFVEGQVIRLNKYTEESFIILVSKTYVWMLAVDRSHLFLVGDKCKGDRLVTLLNPCAGDQRGVEYILTSWNEHDFELVTEF